MSESDTIPVVELSDDGENWLALLRAADRSGWQGTVLEYVEHCRRHGIDPLERRPPAPGTP